jgi:alanine racemase
MTNDQMNEDLKAISDAAQMSRRVAFEFIVGHFGDRERRAKSSVDRARAEVERVKDELRIAEAGLADAEGYLARLRASFDLLTKESKP